MSDRVWYFAHPYSKRRGFNYVLATRLGAVLLEEEWLIVNPVTHSHPMWACMSERPSVEREVELFVDTLDKALLRRCDGLLVADYWADEKSAGCRKEHGWATAWGMPVKLLSEVLGTDRLVAERERVERWFNGTESPPWK